jgi:hypothetical protein
MGTARWAPGATVLDDDGDGDLRGPSRRRIADEPAVRRCHRPAARCRSCPPSARRAFAPRRRTWPNGPRRPAHRAPIVSPSGREPAPPDLRAGSRSRAARARLELVDELRSHHHAVVGDRCRDERHLQRRDQHLALAVGGVGQLDAIDEAGSAARRRRSPGWARSTARTAMRSPKPKRAAQSRPAASAPDVEARVGVPDVARHLRRLVEVERVVGLEVARVVADAEALDQEAGRVLLGWSSKVVCGVIAPEPRPAAAVTILKTEPGTYSPCVARLSSGESSRSLQAGDVSAAVARVDDAVGIEGRVADHRQHAPGRGLDRHHCPTLLAERLGRGRCSATSSDRYRSFGSYGWRGTCAELVARAGARRQPGQLGVVGALESGRAEDDALVADDRRRHRMRIVSPAARAAAAHVARQDLAAGVEDRCPAVPGARQRARADCAVGREPLGLDHLPVPQAAGERRVRDCQRGREPQQAAREASGRCVSGAWLGGLVRGTSSRVRPQLHPPRPGDDRSRERLLDLAAEGAGTPFERRPRPPGARRRLDAPVAERQQQADHGAR